MKAGEILTETDLMAKRPGTGISPDKLAEVVGKALAKDCAEDTVLTWEMVQYE